MVRTGLSALLIIGTWATAGLTQASAADTRSSSEPQASAGILTAMQRDLGLTKSQAEARLTAEKAATAVEGPARSAAGTSFGGSWYDADNERLTVAVTDSAKAGAVRAAGADVRIVGHTARELDSVKSRLDALSAPSGVSSWHVDPEANTVVVNVVASEQGDNDVRAFVAKARKAGPVTVKQTAEAPQTFAAGTVGGDPYYTGNVRCSIGFSVHGGFVTALPLRPGGRSGQGLGRLGHRQLPGLVLPRQRLRLGERGQRLVDRPGGPRLGNRLRPAGPRLQRGPDRRLDLPFRLHHPLALRQRPRQERDRQLQPGRRTPDDQDQRLRRRGRLRRVVHQR